MLKFDNAQQQLYSMQNSTSGREKYLMIISQELHNV